MLLLLLAPITQIGAHQRDTLGTGHRLHFIQNLGQWKEPFLFKSEMNQAAFFAETDCFTFVIKAKDQEESADRFHHQHATAAHAYKVHFIGSNPQVTVTGHDIDPTEGYDNYFIGNKPEHWVSRVPHLKTILYHDLYPGIDMDVRVTEHAMKTNYYVSAGTNPSAIVLEYEGTDKLYLSSGNLIIRTSVGEIVEIRPYAYQECDTGHCEIDVRYRLIGNRVTFVVGDYDTQLPLVIDPVLHFSTYTGEDGVRIAFRNTLGYCPNYYYSINYIDDIKVDLTENMRAVADGNGNGSMSADSYLDGIGVYPNPTTGNLYIDAMDVQKVECYNQMGQLVGVYDNANELNISDLSNGVYMLRITVPQGVTMRKVVKR